MEHVVAETTLIILKPNGETAPVHIEIGCPYKISDEEAACPISMRGLYTDLSDIHGVDTFQALALVFAFVRRTIKGWEEKGYTFQFEGGDPVPDVYTYSDGSLDGDHEQ